jgi:hypothetical protein
VRETVETDRDIIGIGSQILGTSLWLESTASIYNLTFFKRFVVSIRTSVSGPND